MEPTSSGLIDTLSNLNVGWILAIVAVLSLVRYNMLKTDGPGMQAVAEYVESGIVAVVLVWMVIRPFAIQAYFIPSPSMEPTLLGDNGTGDRILVNKFIYRVSNPKHDDVVVFIPPDNALAGGSIDENGMPVNFIKRLIGEPGDEIEAHAGVIFINGVAYDHAMLRMKLAAAGALGSDPGDPIDPQADHHIKFVRSGIQIDDSSKVLSPSDISTIVTGAPNAKVKIVPGYVVRNGRVLDESFAAEDPDYDLKIFNGQPLKATEPFNPGNAQNIGQAPYKLGGQPIDKGTYDLDNASSPAQIPQGHYFMMGDNRNDSEDSTEWGPLDRTRVVGRAQIIFWPPTRIGVIH